MSTGGLHTIHNYRVRKPIALLFLPLNIDLNNEDIEYVFNYGEKTVFMTYSWLLIFNETIFRVDNKEFPSEYSVDKQIIAEPGLSLPTGLFEKHRNCLWTLCENQSDKYTKGTQGGKNGQTKKEEPPVSYSSQLSWHVVLNVIFLIVLMILLAAFLNRKKGRIPDEKQSKQSKLSKLSKLSGKPSRATSLFLSSSKFSEVKSPVGGKKIKQTQNKMTSSDTNSKLQCTFSDLA